MESKNGKSYKHFLKDEPFTSVQIRIKLKVKLWWVGACKKKRAYHLKSEGNFFNICGLAQCLVYWIDFQNIYTFTYQKTLLDTLLLLVLKILESVQCILNGYSGTKE